MKFRKFVKIIIFVLDVFLIETGTDINAQDSSLILSASNGDYNKVKSLIEAGCDVNAKDKNGNTALISTMLRSATPLVLPSPSNKQDSSTSARDYLPTELPYLEISRLLVESGASVNTQNKDGETALMFALLDPFHKTEMVSLLLDNGADVNLANNDGRTPLMLAASVAKDPKIVIELLENGADPNIKDKDGNTSLIRVVSKSVYSVRGRINQQGVMRIEEPMYLGIIETLLKYGADPDVQDCEGRTALMLAASNCFGQTNIVRLMLENDADVCVKDVYGRTALMYASEYGYFRQNNRIAWKCGYRSTSSTAMVNLLIEGGAEVNEKDYDGKTALMAAVAAGHETIVKALLNAGADVNTIDENNHTVLDYAIKKELNYYDSPNKIKEILLEEGAVSGRNG